ncbi:hypothetical protein [Cellulomonas chengniuliangii]|uniref:Uncharacterized protein n=1 Tax=Cellulomonas chengniuliangii TaxID=2968084 RepID=A0ABY5KVT0_9CELL|nr:hypothetical protein [Cellulomonas chengniuliangii]MCC2309974.1 hypothetical protein [Cellulomonas chengniuliangii]MCC2317045.1 hypothetical protein [Cellulomonas chengniuliangii]UUI74627.1 hypothetical protein NP064_12600 [Cellulomonas chengniuliangii]
MPAGIHTADLLAWMISCVAFIGFAILIRVLFRAEVHRRYVSRVAVVFRQLTGMSLPTFARSIIPLTTYLTGVFGVFTLAVPMTFFSTGPGGDWEFVGLAAATFFVAFGAFLLLVNIRTGRPRLLVLPPCRDLTDADVVKWLS